MRGNRPALGAATLGGLLLAAGAVLAWTVLRSHPLYRYDFKGFLGITWEEAFFLCGYAVIGSAAALFVARGLRGLTPRLAGGGPVPTVGFRTGVAVVAAAGALLVAGTAVFLLRRQVVTDDESVYLFQARLLSHGHIALPAPPLAEFLTNVFVVTHAGKWFGQYPPGHPLLLALGTVLGSPRLVPILLAAAQLALVPVLLRRFVGTGWALAGGAFLALSPLFVLTGATYLSHTTAALALAVALWGGLRSLEGNRWRDGVAVGGGLGLLFLARPWTAVTLGVFPLLLVARGIKRGHRRPLLATAILGAAALAALLAANRAVSGDPFVTGYGAVRGPGRIELGFGEVFPGLYTHTPVRGLRNALLLAFRFQAWAWGWPLLLLPMIWGVTGRTVPRPAVPSPLSPRIAARGCAAMLAVGFAAYIPYWSIGVADTGPVKTYELLVPATALAVLGLAGRDREGSRFSPRAFAAASLLVSLAVFWPIQAAHVSRIAARVAAPLERVERTVRPPAVVFVRGVQPAPPWTWVYGRPNPRPDLDDPILYVRDLGDRDPAFIALHPDRRPYRLEYRNGDFHVEPLR